MDGLNEFLSVFGRFTIKDAIMVVIAIVFLVSIYKKISDHLVKRHDAKQAEAAHLQEALESVRKYPEYRQQSLKVQNNLENEIQEVKTEQQEFKQMLKKISARLDEIEEYNKKKERNKLRDILLERHRYYTNKELNPSQSWTTMEAEAFWELFKDYEDAGGDGYMHTVVQPDMERLLVIDI